MRGEALRGVAYSTTSANVRNWCITRALELSGDLDLDRFRGHRFRVSEIASMPVAESLALLRVLLVPRLAEGRDTSLEIQLDDGTSGALHLRNCVAVPLTTSEPDVVVQTTLEVWAEILGGKRSLRNAIKDGDVSTGSPDEVLGFFGCFDLETLS